MFLTSGTVLADGDREAGTTASLPTRSSLLQAKRSYVLAGEASAFLEEGTLRCWRASQKRWHAHQFHPQPTVRDISFQTQQGSHTLPEISVLMLDQALLLISVSGLRTMHSAGPNLLGCSGWEPVIVYITLWLLRLESHLQSSALFSAQTAGNWTRLASRWRTGTAVCPLPEHIVKTQSFYVGSESIPFYFKRKTHRMLSICICSEECVLGEKINKTVWPPWSEPGNFEIHPLVKEKTEPRVLFSWWNAESNGWSLPSLDTWMEDWQPWARNAYTSWASGWSRLEGCLPFCPANLRNSIALGPQVLWPGVYRGT